MWETCLCVQKNASETLLVQEFCVCWTYQNHALCVQCVKQFQFWCDWNDATRWQSLDLIQQAVARQFCISCTSTGSWIQTARKCPEKRSSTVSMIWKIIINFSEIVTWEQSSTEPMIWKSSSTFEKLLFESDHPQCQWLDFINFSETDTWKWLSTVSLIGQINYFLKLLSESDSPMSKIGHVIINLSEIIWKWSSTVSMIDKSLGTFRNHHLTLSLH